MTTPAWADWQYTQWGMSPAEVQSASNGTAVVNQDRKLDAADLTAGLTAFYRGDKRPFTAVFLFDAAGKLSAVTLNPTDRISCDSIRQSLDAHYGAPASLDQQQFGQTAGGTMSKATMPWSSSISARAIVRFNIPVCRPRTRMAARNGLQHQALSRRPRVGLDEITMSSNRTDLTIVVVRNMLEHDVIQNAGLTFGIVRLGFNHAVRANLSLASAALIKVLGEADTIALQICSRVQGYRRG